MKFVIHFEAAQVRDQVVMHAWAPGGIVRDVPGTTDDHRNFRFDLDIASTDPRDISYKFKFGLPNPSWEPDEYIRRIPAKAREIWSFDYSSRYMTKDPAQGQPSAHIMIGAITRSRFKGGAVYVWKPGSTEKERFSESSRENQTNVSNFAIAVRPWMKKGFNFKLVSADDRTWEPDTCSRVWRPADGAKVWVISDLVELYDTRPVIPDKSIEPTYAPQPAKQSSTRPTWSNSPKASS